MQYKMYGQRMPYFAAKLRAYLNFKGLNYQEKPFSILDVQWRLPKNTGSHSIPALKSSSGEWFTDTTEIIEALETRHPKPSILPRTPIQSIASMLFEAWCDDVWYSVAVHTRWSFEENYPLFRKEVGSGLIPKAPSFIQNWVVDNTAARFVRGKMKDLGIVPDQIEMLERWTINILDLFEVHLSGHDYLFGARPTIADYALIGVCYGHLYTDPVPRRELIDPRPNLKGYIERGHKGEKASGELLSDDRIPVTLIPVFEIIGREFVPMLKTLVARVNLLIQEGGLKPGDPVPRFIDDVTYPMGEDKFTRMGFSYALWMMQRVRKQFHDLSVGDQEEVAHWLSSIGASDLLTMDLGPDVDRDGMGVCLVK